MSINFNMRNVFSVIIKICGAIVTGPVTVTVAAGLFSDMPPAIRAVMVVSSVALVEGVFLSSWWQLDHDKTAPQPIKNRNAVTALAVYAGLWILALAHGEGLAGLAIRLSLGLALASSIIDSGVMAQIRAENAADKNILNDWRVKRHARKLARKAAMLDLDIDHELAALSRDARLSIEGQRIALSKQRGLTAVKVENRAILEQNSTRFPYPLTEARQRHVLKSRQRKAELLPKVETLAAAGLSKTDIARSTGLSRQTVGAWLTGQAGNGHKQDTAIPTP